jgi:hypothetical protein
MQLAATKASLSSILFFESFSFTSASFADDDNNDPTVNRSSKAKFTAQCQGIESN